MMPLGLIIAGPLADRLGVQSWFIVGGLISALLGVGAFFVPAITNIEDDSSRQTHPDTGTQSYGAPAMAASPTEQCGD